LNNIRYAIALITFDVSDASPALSEVYRLLALRGVVMENNLEHVSQSGVFFELMNVLKPTPQLTDILNGLRDSNLQRSALETNQSSSIHLNFSEQLLKCFEQHPQNFTVKNEFFGLKSGVFPVDCAVYSGDVLVALIEIDGAHHYTSTGELTRESQFKTWLHEHNYPGVPLHRLKVSEIGRMGVKKSAEQLAKEIIDSCATR
jgi:hypothetical protein